MNLPDLGVGLVHLPGLGPLLDLFDCSPDVIEVEPQAYWSHAPGHGDFEVNPDMLERARRDRPALVHSVGFPVGGLSDGDPRQIPALRETFDCLKPSWWSDHASFVWTGSETDRRHLGFLMPPVQSAESAGVIADRIKRLQDLFGLPFAFETGVNYLRPSDGEMPDGAFWGEISQRADCGILLDLHNLWVNAANGRETLIDAVTDLPLERVWEVHVAGGQKRNGFWLDSHCGMPPPDLLQAVAEIVPKLPGLHAVIFEIIPDYIPVNGISAADLSNCLAALRGIWETRGSQAAPRRTTGTKEGSRRAGIPTMTEWEESWIKALRPAGATGPLCDDPGIGVYRDLISMARRGMIVEALPLTLRFLFESLGEAEVDELFERFWENVSVQPFISDEARAFADFVSDIQLPHLAEILNFELTAHRVAITGETEVVSFTCEPEVLIRSIASGTLEIVPREVHLEVTPVGPSHGLTGMSQHAGVRDDLRRDMQ